MKLTHTALFLTAAMASTLSATTVVSFNIDNNGTVGNPDGTYNGTQSAGIYSTVGWINNWYTYPTSNLPDSTGVATSINITTSSNSGTWSQGGHPGQDTDGSYNKELLNGYLNGTGANSTSVTLSGIPSTWTSYDVYVYFASDNYTRTGTVTDGTTTYSFGVLDNMVAGGNALFTQTTDTGTNYPEANYAVFSYTSGTSQTFSTSFTTAGEYGGIAAIQIVGVPEPTAALLGSLGLLGLLRRRRA